MSKITITIISLLLCLMCVSVPAQDYPQVRVPNTEERELYSKIMDYEYGVYVTLPSSYKKNPDKIYPALYIIDGEQYFIYTFEPYGSLIWGNMIKEHIAISVAYRPGQRNWRSRDFRTTERAADFIDVNGCNMGSEAWNDGHQLHAFQLGQGLPQRGATDAELPAEILFGQRHSGWVFSVDDAISQGLINASVKPVFS